jgi:hypothetical protein
MTGMDMKNFTQKFLVCAALVIGCLLPISAQAQGNQGHHQAGIVGQVNGGVVIATPTGEGSMVIPDHVRVYSDKGKLLTDVETEVTVTANWHFQVFLNPGTYTVIAYAGVPPENGGTLYSFPVTVVVGKKQFTEVALSFRPT